MTVLALGKFADSASESAGEGTGKILGGAGTIVEAVANAFAETLNEHKWAKVTIFAIIALGFLLGVLKATTNLLGDAGDYSPSNLGDAIQYSINTLKEKVSQGFDAGNNEFWQNVKKVTLEALNNKGQYSEDTDLSVMEASKELLLNMSLRELPEDGSFDVDEIIYHLGDGNKNTLNKMA